MVQLLKNGDKDWKAWVLSIAISVIAALTCGISYGSFALIREMRAEFIQEIKDIRVKNNEQDTCLAEIKVEVKNLKETKPRKD